MSTVVPELQQADIGPEVCWELLLRVVNSQELRRAVRLRDLLLYVGKRSIKDHAANIREQEIGAAVFGRPEDYDTNIDNIVRVNVSELRKRLSHYFQEGGAAEPVILEIPRGGYLPVFLSRPAASSAAVSEVPLLPVERLPALPEPGWTGLPPQSAAEQPLVRNTSRMLPETTRMPLGTSRMLLRTLSVCLVLAAALVAVLYRQNLALQAQMRPWQADPARSAFWAQFFTGGGQVDIVTADTSYALAEDILQRPISLDDYLDYKYKDFANLPGITPQTRDALNQVLDRNTGSVGDFEVAERVMELDGHSSLLRLASARSYTPENIKRNNVILIGSRESNPWVELYRDHMNFLVEYDPAHHHSYVVNRVPLQGEPAVYEVPADPDRDYSVVAFLPNLSQHRSALIIAGTDSQGTRAAGEFITSSEGLSAVRQRLPAGRYPYFEVLLSSSRLEGTTLSTSIQTFRGYPR